MQYENNLRNNVFYREKKFGFQKAFFQKVHLEKGRGVCLRTAREGRNLKGA